MSNKLYGGLFVVTFIISSIYSFGKKIPAFKADQNTINVKDFGAKGDGVTDDYKALLAVAAHINTLGGGTILIPQGTYYIAPYHTQDNHISDILFTNCNNLIIRGNHATISVNGSFKRNADRKTGNFWNSYNNEITPLSFYKCSNITIQGLELNGNVDKMSRDSIVIEHSSNLITILDCDNVSIDNVNVHHSQTDGLYIGGKKNVSTNVNVKNSTFSNNARQGMSITSLYKGFFENCVFKNSGITNQAYGRHSPSVGVDIEPNSTTGIKVSNLKFYKCVFENSIGGQFLCSSPQTTDTVTLKNCIISAQTSTTTYQIVLAANYVVLDSCNIDCGIGNLYAGWNTKPGSHILIQKNTIKSSGCGIISVLKSADNIVIIDNNILQYTGISEMKSFFPYLQSPNLVFTNNTIQIPSFSIKANRVSSLIQNAKLAQGNLFITEKASVKPKVSYKGTSIIKDKF
jgi:hypothetical protein